jgi:DNA-binding NarL/FixJ family response regulator
MSIRVLLVLHDEPLREALRSILAEASDIEIAGEATDVAEALVQLDTSSPGVVLIDEDMRGPSVVEMMSLLKDGGYEGPAVILGANLDSLEEALAAGALGYTTKQFLDEELADIIGRVTEGVFAFGPSVMGTPQGMKVALRYMTGQTEADVTPASSPSPESEGPNIKIAAGLWLLGMLIILIAAAIWIALAVIASDYYSVPKAVRDAARAGPGTLSQLGTIEAVGGWVRAFAFVGLASFLLGFGFAFAEILGHVRLRAATMAATFSVLRQRDGAQ